MQFRDTFISKRRVLSLVALSLFVLLCLGSGYFIVTRQQNEPREYMYELAGKLSYNSTAELAQTTHCWDTTLFPPGFAHCGVVVHYTTSLDLDALQSHIQALGFTEQFSNAADGRTIFTDINMDTPHTLSANGNTGRANPVGLQIPQAYRWLLKDPQGREIHISFYATSSSNVHYEFDGLPVQGNIVTLMQQTK